MITKEVGLSASPLGTVVVWECEDCHRRWTGVSRKPCPYCQHEMRSDAHYRWND
jgi:rubrerythrin